MEHMKSTQPRTAAEKKAIMANYFNPTKVFEQGEEKATISHEEHAEALKQDYLDKVNMEGKYAV